MEYDNTFIKNAVENINRINGNKNLLDILLEFEQILDESGIYAYRNWIDGEIVEGPILERHWFKVTLMYPYKKMPNPLAMRRLKKQGCRINYERGKIEVPVKVQSISDIQDLKTKTPKTVKKNIWLIKIEMPRRYIEEFNDKNIDVSGENIDLESLTQAYDEGLDNAEEAKHQGDDIQDDQRSFGGSPESIFGGGGGPSGRLSNRGGPGSEPDLNNF